ncbi:MULTISPECIES: hypothetical protein [unclassified Psychrobacter]|uniref:hypothetical protein n=1 Tax=unclassified Psychrobacter TaxID=196806 RepID=UPI003F4898AC
MSNFNMKNIAISSLLALSTCFAMVGQANAAPHSDTTHLTQKQKNTIAAKQKAKQQAALKAKQKAKQQAALKAKQKAKYQAEIQAKQKAKQKLNNKWH